MNEKKGISLIILVITIVVILIISGTVIYFLGQSSMVQNAKDAVLRQDLANFKMELNNYIVNKAKEEQGFTKEDLTFLDIDDIKKCIPSVTEKYDGLITIANGELFYESFTKRELKIAMEAGVGKDKTKVPKKVSVKYFNNRLGYDINGVVPLKDGGYIIKYSKNVKENENMFINKYIVRVNSKYEEIWEKKYEGANSKLFVAIVDNIVECKNGDILYDVTANTVENNVPKKEYKFIRLNKEGELIKEYPQDEKYKFFSVIEKPNGNLVMLKSVADNIDNSLIIKEVTKDFEPVKTGMIKEEKAEFYAYKIKWLKNDEYILDTLSYNDSIVYKLDKDLKIVWRNFKASPTHTETIDTGSTRSEIQINKEKGSVKIYNRYAFLTGNDVRLTHFREIDKEGNTIDSKKLQEEFNKINVRETKSTKNSDLYAYGNSEYSTDKQSDIKYPFISRYDKNFEKLWTTYLEEEGGEFRFIFEVGKKLIAFGGPNDIIKNDSAKESKAFIVEYEF